MRVTWAFQTCIGLICSIPITCAVPHHQKQIPVMASPAVIPQDAAPSISSEFDPQLLSDTLSSQRALSIFASLVRSDMDASTQLSDQSAFTVILAPTNKAIKAMNHKPWEETDDAKALDGHPREGRPGVDQAQRNLRTFVHSHLVKGGSQNAEWAEGEKRTRGDQDKEVWWEVKDGKKTIMPEGIAIDSFASKVVNGEVWALEGILKA